MTTARFKINGTPALPRAFDASHTQTLTLQLESIPDPDIYQTQFFIYDPGNPSAPLASLSAPLLTLTPSSGIPTLPGGTVTFVTPASGAHTYEVRCVLNGGVRAATGKVVPEWTFERIVALRSSNGLRKELPAETTQYVDRGWADEQNRMVDAIAGALAGGALPVGGADAVLLMNHAGDTAVFSKIKDANVADDAALAVAKLATGTPFQVLTAAITTGIAVWGAVHLDQAAALAGVGADGLVPYAHTGTLLFHAGMSYDPTGPGKLTLGSLQLAGLASTMIAVDGAGKIIAAAGGGVGTGFPTQYYADVATMEAASIAGFQDQQRAVLQSLHADYELNIAGTDGGGATLVTDHVNYLVLATAGGGAQRWVRRL